MFANIVIIFLVTNFYQLEEEHSFNGRPTNVVYHWITGFNVLASVRKILKYTVYLFIFFSFRFNYDISHKFIARFIEQFRSGRLRSTRFHKWESYPLIRFVPHDINLFHFSNKIVQLISKLLECVEIGPDFH